ERGAAVRDDSRSGIEEALADGRDEPGRFVGSEDRLREVECDTGSLLGALPGTVGAPRIPEGRVFDDGADAGNPEGENSSLRLLALTDIANERIDFVGPGAHGGLHCVLEPSPDRAELRLVFDERCA